MLRSLNRSKCGGLDETDELVQHTMSLIACASQFRSVENLQQCRKVFAAAYVSTCVKAGGDGEPIEMARRAFELFAQCYELAEKSVVPEQQFRTQLMDALYRAPLCS